jgi:uncharacterized phiE125 gp8 family phage protein
MRYFVITPPAEPAVSLEEMKAHLRVDHTDDDDRITELVAAAQAGFEDSEMGTAGRPIAAQQVEIETERCDRFPLKLFGPIDIDEAVEVVYRDASGAEVTVSDASYRIDRADTFSPRLAVLNGWPFVTPVHIRCTVGLYNDDPRLGNFKSAIKLHVQTIYDGVEDLERYRQTMENLIAPYRVMSL